MSGFGARRGKASAKALLHTLVDLGLTDDWQHVIDRSRFAALSRQWAERGALAEAFDRSRRGFTSKVHAHCDNQ